MPGLSSPRARLAALAALAWHAGCAAADSGLPAHDAPPPSATFSVYPDAGGAGEQAVDPRGRWFAATRATTGGGSADFTLTLTPLVEGDTTSPLTTQVRHDRASAEAQSGAWTGAKILFAADANRLALACPAQLVATDGALEVAALPGPDPCFANAMAFAAGGTALAAACGSGVLRVWDLAQPGGAPTDTALPAQSMDGSVYSAAALTSRGDGTWRLALAGHNKPPTFITIDHGQVAVTKMAAAEAFSLGTARMQFHPETGDRMLFAGTSAKGIDVLIIDKIATSPSVFAFPPPPFGVELFAAQYSPDGAHVLGHLGFRAGKAAAGWTQAVAWTSVDGAIVGRTGDMSRPLTGNAMDVAGHIFAWSDQTDGPLGRWQL